MLQPEEVKEFQPSIDVVKKVDIPFAKLPKRVLSREAR